MPTWRRVVRAAAGGRNGFSWFGEWRRHSIGDLCRQSPVFLPPASPLCAARHCHWQSGPSSARVGPVPMKRRDGFTLLEICLVVAIIVMVALIAVPSVSGVFAEERLRRSYDALDSLV